MLLNRNWQIRSAAGIPETEGDNQLQESSTGTGSTWLPEHGCAPRSEESGRCGDDGCRNPTKSRTEEDDIMSARESERACSLLANGEEQVSYSE